MFTERTKIKEIMHIPNILEIVEKYTKVKMNMNTLKMGANFTIGMVGKYFHWTKMQMREVLEELNKKANF